MRLIFPQPIFSEYHTLFLHFLTFANIMMSLSHMGVVSLHLYSMQREETTYCVVCLIGSMGKIMYQGHFIKDTKKDKLVFILQMPYSPAFLIIFSSPHYTPKFCMSLLNHNNLRIKGSSKENSAKKYIY